MSIEEIQLVTLLAKEPSTLSAAMHTAGYEHLGLNFVYLPFSVIDCRKAVDGIRAVSNYRGCSVTMPYKQEVMQYLDRIDAVAEKIRAVNTIVHEHGALTGYNTDWCGAMDALKEVTELRGKKVILIGAGGAARAFAHGLRMNEALGIVYSRTPGPARDIADEFGLEYGGTLEALAKMPNYDIIINATPVGSHGEESILDEAALQEGKIVMDIVPMPLETKLLKLAKQKGCTIIPGYKMLVHQAVPQFRLFTGRDVPFDVMERAALNELK